MADLHLLGIRHHGPGSARSVVAALDELQPDVVLVEAPAEATRPFEWIGGGLIPPVALLGWVRADPRRASFAPFARFSPEWQAVNWANAAGVIVDAIDLPLANSLAIGDDDDPPALGVDGRPADPIGALAAAAGDDDPERWWEDTIEHRGDGPTIFDAVADAMSAIRSGTITSEAEHRREAHMRKRVRAAMKNHDRVAVICGAWHVPALDPASVTASSDATTLRGLPRVKVDVSWVPWTHRRLSAPTYGAGVRSPGWYDHIFAHADDEPVTRFLVAAARALRAHDLAASPDHLIATSRLADSLAALRGRPRAGLDEIVDAAEAVMGGRSIISELLVVGDAIGSVPSAAPQVPLARDIAQQQKSARLKPVPEEVSIELDLRTPNGLRRSHLLHRMGALGVSWGAVVDGRGSSGTFRESWELSWRPDNAVTIIERAAYGTTLEHAATTRLVQRADDAAGIAELAGALDIALLADLGSAIDPIVTRLANRAATDPDVVALMASLAPLANALRYGDVRATDADAIAAVFDGVVIRVLAGVVTAARSLDDAAAALFVERLSQVQTALAVVGHRALATSFRSVLNDLTASQTHGLVHGRATRLLHDSGAWSQAQVEARLGRALSGGTPPARGAAFVEGFLAGSGTVLVHDAGLRQLVDHWLSGLRPEAFDEVVPLLRRTFGGFDPAERRQLGRLMTGDEPDRPTVIGDDLDPARLVHVVATVRHMLGLAR